MHYITGYTHIFLFPGTSSSIQSINRWARSIEERTVCPSTAYLGTQANTACTARHPAPHCCWVRCSQCSAPQIKWRTHSSFSISPTNLSHHTMVTIVYILITIPQPHWCYGHCLHGSAKQWSCRQGRRWHCHSPPAHPVNSQN
jgi:hypothetical protein